MKKSLSVVPWHLRTLMYTHEHLRRSAHICAYPYTPAHTRTNPNAPPLQVQTQAYLHTPMHNSAYSHTPVHIRAYSQILVHTPTHLCIPTNAESKVLKKGSEERRRRKKEEERKKEKVGVRICWINQQIKNLKKKYLSVQILSLKLLIYQMLGHCVMPHFEETQSQALFKHKWN